MFQSVVWVLLVALVDVAMFLIVFTMVRLAAHEHDAEWPAA